MFGGGVTLPAMLGGMRADLAHTDLLHADDWMSALTGKHRTVFDVAEHRNGGPLHRARNFLDGWREGHHVPEQQVNLVIGIQGDATPMLLSDALWSRYRLGEHFAVTDPATRAPATKNLFIAANVTTPGLVPADLSVDALQRRGVRFVICVYTLRRAAGILSAAGLGAPEEIAAALADGLLPGVIEVPAMVVALAQLQERGVTYVKVS